MAVKIRLARHGKKGYPFYHIVAADSRAPRDGRFIEKIGTYNPNTNPATIELKFDRALYWLNVGAQPTETCRLILSYRGVLLKKHLLEGVKKGALTEEAAQQKFDAWVEEKNSKIEAKKNQLHQTVKSQKEVAFAAEVKVKETKEAELLAKKKAEAEAAKAAEAVTEETPAEETPAETTEA